MGKQWKNPPVYFVIAQVRFNPVLNLASYLATIQENFRKAQFPDFRTFTNVTYNFGLQPGGKVEDQLTMLKSERYLFGNEESTETFLLDPNGLTYQTTAYKTSDVLMETFLSMLEFLRTTLGLSYSDRVGLRYLDAVMPGADESLETYLIPQVIGIRGRVDGVIQHTFTETMSVVPAGKLLSRVVIQNGPIGVPPDLQLHVSGVKLDRRFLEYSGQYAIIDTDGFNDTRGGIDRNAIEKKLNELHEYVDAAFRATITEHAIKMWS